MRPSLQWRLCFPPAAVQTRVPLELRTGWVHGDQSIAPIGIRIMIPFGVGTKIAVSYHPAPHLVGYERPSPYQLLVERFLLADGAA